MKAMTKNKNKKLKNPERAHQVYNIMNFKRLTQKYIN